MRISDWSSDVCSSDLKLQGQDAEAIDAYSMAVAIKPAYAEAHINLGKIAIDHKKYELGEKACLKAIEADPAIAHPYVNLCMLKRLQGQFDESIRDRKSTRLNSSH